MGITKAKFVLIGFCVVAAVSAQSETTKAILGVSRLQQTMGYHIACMQYNNNATNTPSSIYGDTLPSGSKIYKWTGSGYQSATYGPVFIPGSGLVTKWDADLSLDSGEGFWVYGAASIDTFLSGNVPVDDAITNSIASGFQICSYSYPVGRVVTNMGFSATSGDKIYVWNGTNYVTSSYGQVFVPGQGLVVKWDNENLQVKVGQGFWYQSTATNTWVALRPFSLN